MDDLLKRLREQRAASYKRMEELQGRLISRDDNTGTMVLSAEDRDSFDKAEADLNALNTEIERRERFLATGDSLRQPQGHALEGAVAKAAPAGEVTAETRDAAYNAFIRSGLNPNNTQRLAGGSKPMTDEQRAIVLGLEVRDQGVGGGSAGGFLVPQGFLVKLTERMKWYGPMRDVANKIQTASGNDMPWPNEDDTANVGAILGENTSVSELDVVLASKTLKAWMYTSGIVKVSWQLLNDSAFDVESHLSKVLATRLGRIQNTHFTTGTGTGQPEGILTPAVGIPASQVNTEATGHTATITYNGLVNLVRTLDPAYYPSGPSFQMHNTTLGAVRLLVDGNQRPLWTPNYGAIAGGDPDNILGYPVKINNDFTAFSALTASTISMAFGDWEQAYIVRDVLGISLVRLDERFADQLQTGFFAYCRTDGRVDDKFAYAVTKTSAS